VLVLNKRLVEVLEDIEDAVEMNAVYLQGAHHVDCLVVLGVDDAGQLEGSAHGSERQVSRYRHLVLNQQVAANGLPVETLVSQRPDVAIEIEIHIARQAEGVSIILAILR